MKVTPDEAAFRKRLGVVYAAIIVTGVVELVHVGAPAVGYAMLAQGANLVVFGITHARKHRSKKP